MRITVLDVSKIEPAHLEKFYRLIWAVCKLWSTEVHFDRDKEAALLSPVSLALGGLFILPGISSSVTLWPCEVLSQLWLLNCIIRNDKQADSIKTICFVAVSIVWATSYSDFMNVNVI